MDRVSIMACRRPWFLILLAVMMLATAALGRPHESFKLDAAAWEATHVVVVTEEPRMDGDVLVLESWKGDIKAREHIAVPQLASFQTLSSREVERLGPGSPNDSPEYVTGKSMILFLKRGSVSHAATHQDEAAEPDKAVQPKEDGATSTWICEDRDGVKGSVIWVDAGRTFAFFQPTIPGRGFLAQFW